MTDNLVIVTNNRPRDTFRWEELSEKERRDFDYLETEEAREEAVFFRYRGNAYGLHEFLTTAHVPDFSRWHGYHCDSWFSGVLVRLVEDGDRVICGRYFQ